MQSEYVKGIEKYIIHVPECTRRTELVEKIIEFTGAKRYDAIRAKDGAIGCYLSHIEIIKKNPEVSVVIFEDDCVINVPDMLNMLDDLKDFDIVYFGVNRIFDRDDKTINSNFKPGTKINSFGTHAMWVSSKARKIMLDYVARRPYFKPMDGLWNLVENEFDLKVWRPPPGDIYKFCEQKVGELSIIDGRIRKDFYSKDSWGHRRCNTPTCLFKVHPDVRNNYGTHCCLGCKKNQGHGPLCVGEIWQPKK